jgi:hypothetical protein
MGRPELFAGLKLVVCIAGLELGEITGVALVVGPELFDEPVLFVVSPLVGALFVGESPGESLYV